MLQRFRIALKNSAENFPLSK